MSRDRAAYMREYRAKRRNDVRDGVPPIGAHDSCRYEVLHLRGLLVAANDEIARLKRELASRTIAGPSFNSRPFTPVPK